MESWMVSLGGAVIGIIAAFAVTRHLVSDQGRKIKALEDGHKRLKDNEIKELKTFKDEKSPLLDHLSKAEDALRLKIDKQSEEVVFLKEKMNNAATMKEVRDDFVSKELFLAMKEHFNSKFEHLDQTIEKGLHEVAKKIEAKL